MNRREFIGLMACVPLIKTNLFATENTLEDIFATPDEWKTILSLRTKLNGVKNQVGSGNFNIISFDTMLTTASRYSKIGAFNKNELDMMDKIFYDDPTKYGFYGTKILDHITYEINEKDTIKVGRTGQYLFKGKPVEDYKRILKDVGKDVILTSGIRAIPKQISLYVDKIYALDGNISGASRIIAPPAYTYHTIHDFDVGKKGLGAANFTEEFAATEEFKKLVKLNYVDIRYVVGNKDGVIYEPWHIKVG
jgi:zinc D-Ala-D-Ala carboxypeptidase